MFASDLAALKPVFAESSSSSSSSFPCDDSPDRPLRPLMFEDSPPVAVRSHAKAMKALRAGSPYSHSSIRSPRKPVSPYSGDTNRSPFKSLSPYDRSGGTKSRFSLEDGGCSPLRLNFGRDESPKRAKEEYKVTRRADKENSPAKACGGFAMPKTPARFKSRVAGAGSQGRFSPALDTSAASAPSSAPGGYFRSKDGIKVKHPKIYDLDNGLVIMLEGKEHPISASKCGTYHMVHHFTGPRREITVNTVSGPVTFNSDEYCLRRLLLVGTPSNLGVMRMHEGDMEAYDLYVTNGLNVPKMIVRPDPCNGKPLHPQTVMDSLEPKTGGFALVRAAQTGFTLTGVRQASDLSKLSGDTAQLFNWAIGEWKKFVLGLATNGRAIFDDFKPANVGRIGGEFCHLDPTKPDLSPARILVASLREFVDGNENLFCEIVGLLWKDPALLKHYGDDKDKFALFVNYLGAQMSQELNAMKANNNGHFPLPRH